MSSATLVTLTEFVMAARSGKVVIDGGSESSGQLVEHGAVLPNDDKDIAADAFMLGLLDSDKVTWDEGVKRVALIQAGGPGTMKAAAYSTTRRTYHRAVESAVSDYLDSNGAVTRWRNDMGRAVIEAFTDAYARGFADGGGDAPTPEDDQWLTDRQQAELGFVTDLFATLRESRDTIADAAATARQHADGYAATLDAVYSQGKLEGGRNRTLVFSGDDGKENCGTCWRLKGKRRTVKWILENDMLPYPGNPNFECLSYECRHFWADAKTGERVTL